MNIIKIIIAINIIDTTFRSVASSTAKNITEVTNGGGAEREEGEREEEKEEEEGRTRISSRPSIVASTEDKKALLSLCLKFIEFKIIKINIAKITKYCTKPCVLSRFYDNEMSVCTRSAGTQ